MLPHGTRGRKAVFLWADEISCICRSSCRFRLRVSQMITGFLAWEKARTKAVILAWDKLNSLLFMPAVSGFFSLRQPDKTARSREHFSGLTRRTARAAGSRAVGR